MNDYSFIIHRSEIPASSTHYKIKILEGDVGKKLSIDSFLGGEEQSCTRKKVRDVVSKHAVYFQYESAHPSSFNQGISLNKANYAPINGGPAVHFPIDKKYEKLQNFTIGFLFSALLLAMVTMTAGIPSFYNGIRSRALVPFILFLALTIISLTCSLGNRYKLQKYNKEHLSRDEIEELLRTAKREAYQLLEKSKAERWSIIDPNVYSNRLLYIGDHARRQWNFDTIDIEHWNPHSNVVWV